MILWNPLGSISFLLLSLPLGVWGPEGSERAAEFSTTMGVRMLELDH